MFFGLFSFFLLFQKGYAKCYSNLLISYNQTYLGQMNRQCKMQYTTLSSPGKALVSDNSISISNFSCICILPLIKICWTNLQGYWPGCCTLFINENSKLQNSFQYFLSSYTAYSIYTVNNRFSFLFSHHQPFLVHILRTLTYSWLSLFHLHHGMPWPHLKKKR